MRKDGLSAMIEKCMKSIEEKGNSRYVALLSEITLHLDQNPKSVLDFTEIDHLGNAIGEKLQEGNTDATSSEKSPPLSDAFLKWCMNSYQALTSFAGSNDPLPTSLKFILRLLTSANTIFPALRPRLLLFSLEKTFSAVPSKSAVWGASTPGKRKALLAGQMGLYLRVLSDTKTGDEDMDEDMDEDDYDDHKGDLLSKDVQSWWDYPCASGRLTENFEWAIASLLDAQLLQELPDLSRIIETVAVKLMRETCLGISPSASLYLQSRVLTRRCAFFKTPSAAKAVLTASSSWSLPAQHNTWLLFKAELESGTRSLIANSQTDIWQVISSVLRSILSDAKSEVSEEKESKLILARARLACSLKGLVNVLTSPVVLTSVLCKTEAFVKLLQSVISACAASNESEVCLKDGESMLTCFGTRVLSTWCRFRSEGVLQAFERTKNSSLCRGLMRVVSSARCEAAKDRYALILLGGNSKIVRSVIEFFKRTWNGEDSEWKWLERALTLREAALPRGRKRTRSSSADQRDGENDKKKDHENGVMTRRSSSRIDSEQSKKSGNGSATGRELRRRRSVDSKDSQSQSLRSSKRKRIVRG
mmetsp:Transcript_13533/g.20323  ORF Transcript_13533/g.20323 Transcript_13533/m.20323 type:complete len:589 (-) Transcript_13533:114-1880(-)|eukprot:CAMPEP_0167756868 /NCGR_PEP_ID=MMETSP0110_2-20121227/9617_1 /TAXON_ID=629695 /ORGANISM="Gymnochlora sp., Strain CCMP2014" /LENGTH=588 /DNA_ID=CAMNT_0007643011 /DNA_START=2023 /DNA_END=3789 /DNA_ORIENTATION=+